MATCKLSLSHTHTALTHKQTDASVCHPSLSAWTTPKRRGLAKCCPGTEKIYIFQLVADLISLCLIYSLILSSSFYPQFLFLLSNFSSSFFPSLLLQYHLTIFSSISFFLSFSLSLRLHISKHRPNPEPQWVCKLMQRICEELGIQLEKIRLLSFQPDI